MENKTIFEWAEMLQEQIQAGASQSDIIQILKEYENQALRIHDVVGRSEQLVCEHRHIMWINSDWKYICLECGKTGIEAN